MTDEPVDAAASANGAVLIGLQLGPTAIDSLVALGWLAEPARADPPAIADAVVALLKNAGARSFSARAGGNPAPQPPIALASDTPWGCEALMRLHESGRPLGYCWDAIILRWLRNGDVRPLAHSFALGLYQAEVLHWFAVMLFPDFALRCKQPDAKVKPRDYAYRLKVVAQHGRRGRRSDSPEHESRFASRSM